MARPDIHRQGSSLSLACGIAAILVNLCYATSLPNLTGGRHNFTVYDNNNRSCLQASFELNFYIYYNGSRNNNSDDKGLTTANVRLPNPENISMVGGVCDSVNGNYSLQISWFSDTNFTTELRFSNFSEKNQSHQWTLYQIRFTFNSSNKNYFGDGLRDDADSETQMYYTEEATWFNRTVHLYEYFFCHRCKTIKFSSQSGACRDNTSCSYLTLAKAVIFLGNYDNVMPTKQICFEDWVAEREMLVPIAVGGFLVVLLVIVIFAYVVAFIRRYVRDKHAYHKMN